MVRLLITSLCPLPTTGTGPAACAPLLLLCSSDCRRLCSTRLLLLIRVTQHACRYTEARSQWTLDYPPLFAYFEYFLSLIGGRIDPGMLQVLPAGAAVRQQSTC